MKEAIRSRLALEVFHQDLDQNQKVQFLEKLKSLPEDQIREITLHILDRGLETMPDLSWLRGLGKRGRSPF